MVSASLLQAPEKLAALLEKFQAQNQLENNKTRIKWAAQFKAGHQRYHYFQLCRPSYIGMTASNHINLNSLETNNAKLYHKYENIRTLKAQHCLSTQPQRLVVSGHDGGFFSVFNIYLTHLVWFNLYKTYQYVLPDWRLAGLKKIEDHDKFKHFCYGTEADQNIWVKLCGVPYNDLSAADLNDADRLYAGADGPYHGWNHDREPHLTNLDVILLYGSPYFAEWRRWYHQIYQQHVDFNADIQKRVAEFRQQAMQDKFVIGLQIRHPSHSVEQLGKRMLTLQNILPRMLAYIKAHAPDDNWAIFIATDQEAVIRDMKNIFGDRILCLPDAPRTSVQQDAEFKTLDAETQKQTGFQIQHRLASDQAAWGTHLAEYVIIDALLLSHCQALFHQVSNIATAVSYFNPDIEMIYCS